MTETKAKTRVRISHLFLCFTVVAVIGFYANGLWLAYDDEKKLTPVLALNTVTKVLLAHHKKAGRFPETFADVDEKSWLLKPAPVVGHEGYYSLYFAHYYYLYTAVQPSICNIWALPAGNRREKGSTYFLVLSPDGIRRWKGPALSDDEIKRISPIPTEPELASIGLIEQEPIHFKRQSQRRAGM